ncbi:hypothetical protein SAMN05428975_5140 [Mucilaginibacter sp. OK268]|uniref:DUF7825 domain-containing protein n=1 Tax=Mucilaginibacter sp. OK268 TaxID=1881048 RepID=UPI00087E0AD7|nr:DUF6493 family protein [Mucilaginibacter sp. OK268]SDP99743.1 hypothetical protein SAMN05428975_5140 [Mucilaginibacter sp. OK268]
MDQIVSKIGLRKASRASSLFLLAPKSEEALKLVAYSRMLSLTPTLILSPVEIYGEVLSVNKSTIINEHVIARLNIWESTETLKKVIQKMK